MWPIRRIIPSLYLLTLLLHFCPQPCLCDSNIIAAEEKQQQQQQQQQHHHQQEDPTKLLLNATEIFQQAQDHFYGRNGVQRSLKQAFALYRQAASLDGHGLAQFMSGFFYTTGVAGVVRRDQAKAMVHYSFGARQGDYFSQAALGYRHLAGIGCSRSCDEAIQYYHDAAKSSIRPYAGGPPVRLPTPSFKLRLSDEAGGVYGSGASGPGASDPEQSSLGAVSEEDILQFYQYNAERNDIQSQYVLGQLYYYGSPTVERNFDRAFRLLRAAAQQLPVAAASNNRLSGGGGRTAATPSIAAAAQAASLLGEMYWRGDAVRQDNGTALKWFHRAAENGDANGFANLGLMYLYGVVVPKSKEKAILYLKRAAEKDHAEALVQLGLLAGNRLASPDFATAHKHFSAAAKHGHPVALYNLGLIYRLGLSVQSNCMLAVTLFKSAAERSDEAKELVADAYGSLETDPERSLLSYMVLAEIGVEIAQTNVAWILETGKYQFSNQNETDYTRALYWNRAANQGNVDARVKMGDYNFYGVGTSPNLKKAFSYYTTAEMEQSALAMYNLGYMHENGLGVPRDFHLAKRMYDRALTTNPEAYLPINLALFRLQLKHFWLWLGQGGPFWLDEMPADMTAGGTSSASTAAGTTAENGGEDVTVVQLPGGDSVRLTGDQQQQQQLPSSAEHQPGPQQQQSATDRSPPVGNDDLWSDDLGAGGGFDDDEDSELATIVVLVLAAAFLMWVRQQQPQHNQMNIADQPQFHPVGQQMNINQQQPQDNAEQQNNL